MKMNFYVDKVDFGTPECDDILHLRYEVLRKPLNLVFYEKDISEEYRDIHLGGYNVFSDELAGCLLLRPLPDNRIKMRQVAVRPELQGQGIGRILVLYSEKWSREHGFEIMELNARLQAVPFYEKLGYSKKGDMFKEVGLDHYYMCKTL